MLRKESVWFGWGKNRLARLLSRLSGILSQIDNDQPDSMFSALIVAPLYKAPVLGYAFPRMKSEAKHY